VSARAPYAPGQLVSIAYEPDTATGPYRRRPPLLLRSIVTVTSVVPMADVRYRVGFTAVPGREAVAYVMDADGSASGEVDFFGPLGCLAPDGHPWIQPAETAADPAPHQADAVTSSA
jgi:hypothetical protein